MESNLGRLVTFRTKENYEVIGMIFCSLSQNNDTIVIHIHGNFGNFYQNKFLWIMSEVYIKNGVDFLTINLSSHDGLAEGYYGRELKYVGGGVADYNCSQADIEAAINFAVYKGYKHIILQGHSLGCDKVIQYTLENKSDIPLILLSPVDSYRVQSDWIKPETINAQIVRLKHNLKNEDNWGGTADLDWLDPHEYGARGNTEEWIYQIPITRNALISILDGAAFKYLNVDFGTDFLIQNQVYIFIGKHDGLQMHEMSKWVEFLRKSFAHSEIMTSLDADHDIVGVENELSEAIIEWIKKL